MVGESTNQEVDLPVLAKHGVRLFIKREDRIHPLVSGNKYRKLKYNLEAAIAQGHTTLLTFGGAYSNHIAATACAGAAAGLKTIGVIRGAELAHTQELNPTLTLAEAQGMRFYFVDRQTYREKDQADFHKLLEQRFGTCYLLPEGGSNSLAVQGCSEILGAADADFDCIATAVGTGGTLAGLSNAAWPGQRVLGFSILKGGFLSESIRKFASKSNWELIEGYHFGGYAKVTEELVHFINTFKATTGIPLDPVYTGKLLFGLIDSIEKGLFSSSSRILAIHTGGLQGIAGMNSVLKQKNLPLLE